jgi:4a-hydroxytetrahydrobiopterin dehydratase
MPGMTENPERRLTRQEISDGISEHGWRLILGAARTHVPVGSLALAVSVAGQVIDAAGAAADECLRADIRRDRLVLTLQDPGTGWLTSREITLAARITDVVRGLGLVATAEAGTAGSAQLMEIAIDALDIPAVVPFWKAVLAYVEEPGATGPVDALVDPHGLAPAVWFQQMDAPRPQRNRIHVDISVPHDEAGRRIEAALAAGGTLLSDAEAPAFWVLADPEGNEACVTTWQGRDRQPPAP